MTRSIARMVAPLMMLLACTWVSGARGDETGGFVVRLGRDTLSVESFTRTATQVRGEYVSRSPRSTHRRYTMELAPDGTVRKFEMVTSNLGSGPGRSYAPSAIAFAADSATTTFPRGDTVGTTRVASGPGAVPFVLGAIGLMDQVARQARAAKSTTYSFPLVAVGATQPSTGTVTRGGGDTLLLNVSGPLGTFGPWILRADSEGRLLEYRGPGTPFQGEATRLASADVPAAQAAYANRPLGQLSERDTTRARFGDAELWVDYGRPLKRGRTVFGNVVRWNFVWRTGANAATQFHTPVDLEIAGAAVPAGTYTLWTLPSPDGWKLILNRQTGQWGTMHDPEQDLARIDMKVETLAEPVEQLTIAIDPQAGDGVLSITWDRTRATVPIRRKP